MSYKTIEGLTRQLTQEALVRVRYRRRIRLQQTVDSEFMVWWRDWYEDGVIEPWDGPHPRPTQNGPIGRYCGAKERGKGIQIERVNVSS